MYRITDLWSGLGRREQVLVAIGVGAMLLLLIWLTLLRSDPEVAAIDASTTAVESTAGPIEPEPGMIVANAVPAEAAPTEAEPPPASVAPVQAGGGGGAATPSSDREGQQMDAEALRTAPSDYVPDPGYRPPVVSNAVKQAGRTLEQVARNYLACMQRLAGKDTRPCMNELTGGVSTFSNPHDDGKGITLTKASSDGHRLDYTVIKGQVCRALDGGESCDAWTAK